MVICKKLKISNTVLAYLKRVFESPDYEQGCLFGCSKYLNYIDNICTVEGISQDKCCYIPNMKAVNTQINEWREQGIYFCGVIHSHVYDDAELSDNDRKSAESWLLESSLPFLWIGVLVVVNGYANIKIYLVELTENKKVQMVPFFRVRSIIKHSYTMWRRGNEKIAKAVGRGCQPYLRVIIERRNYVL